MKPSDNCRELADNFAKVQRRQKVEGLIREARIMAMGGAYSYQLLYRLDSDRAQGMRDAGFTVNHTDTNTTIRW